MAFVIDSSNQPNMRATTTYSQSANSPAMAIYPVHFLDDRKDARKTVMGWIFRVNARLDAGKVCAALRRVLEIGNWRKLAGTLHHNDAGKLEIHVPLRFTDDFQPFTYKHVDHTDESFDDCETRGQFPNQFSNTSIVFDLRPEFKDFIFDRDWPSNVDGYITRGLPQLGLRITSFKDVTLLAVTWPHTALDGSTKRDLLEAWSLALAGKEEQIRPVLGARDDIAWKLAGSYSEDELAPDVLADKRLAGVGYYIFLFRLLWRMLKEEARDHSDKLFLLPRDVLQRWRDEGARDIPVDPVTGTPKFISDSDLIAAWLVKLTAAASRQPWRYSAIGSVNARSRLPQVVAEEGVYLQNLLAVSFCPVSAGEAAGSVAGIAYAIRRGLDEQLTADQMVHHFRRHRHEMETGQGDAVRNLFCRSGEAPVMYSNLSALRVASAIDFGPAVVPNSDGSRSSGAVVNHYFKTAKPFKCTRPAFVIMDQNEAGYFVKCDAPQKAWVMIMKEIGAKRTSSLHG